MLLKVEVCYRATSYVKLSQKLKFSLRLILFCDIILFHFSVDSLKIEELMLIFCVVTNCF